jgi:hypothetical protein
MFIVVLKHFTPVGLLMFTVLPGLLLGNDVQPLGVGSPTFAKGSAWAIVKGCRTVPLPQFVLDGIPPTAAIGLAVTVDEPVATAALSEVEFVIIPQPRLTFVLPLASIPVTLALSKLMTQYLPAGTIVAVAVAVMFGAALMNIPEKLSGRCIETVTRTALLSVVKPPVDGGFVAEQTGVCGR